MKNKHQIVAEKETIKSGAKAVIKNPDIEIIRSEVNVKTNSSSIEFLRTEKTSTFTQQPVMAYRTSFILFIKSMLRYYFPLFIAKEKIDFIFLVHVRYMDDYRYGLSCFNFLEKLLPKRFYASLIRRIPPLILDHITTDHGIKGKIITTTKLANELILKKGTTEQELNKIKRLVRNSFESGKIFIGLGGWWPIVSLNGKIAQKVFNEANYIITTGHAGTIVSILKMVDDLVLSGNIKKSRFHLAIIGAGNIGGTLCELLLRKYRKLTIIDINEKKIEMLKNKLTNKYRGSEIRIATFDQTMIKTLLEVCHIGICATSSASYIVTKDAIPENFIFIDDSRPEAIPRFEENDNRVTLEGGLYKIPNIKMHYDFGFGINENVWGCLSEAYMLSEANRTSFAMDNTVGHVTESHIQGVFSFLENSKIEAGDYLMGQKKIDKLRLINILKKRDQSIRE